MEAAPAQENGGEHPDPTPAPAAASTAPPPEKIQWDPFEAMRNRTPSLTCLKRIRKDLKEMFRDPLPGIFVVPDETLNTVVHALITGPFETPYEGGFFYFVVNCPDDYPSSPPKVRLMTTGGGSVRFNPNLYANGKVCLSILGTWSGPSWSPVHSLASILVSIQSLMNDKPYHNEPGFENGPNRDVINYNDCIRHETLRVAVCEMLEDNSFSRGLPGALRDVMRGLYPSFVEGYAMTCAMNRSKDGGPMVDPFGAQRGVFQYGNIEQRLNTLRESIGDVCDDDDEEEEEDGDENGENDEQEMKQQV